MFSAMSSMVQLGAVNAFGFRGIGAGDAAGDGDQHFAGDGAGFMRQPADRGGDEFRVHRRVFARVQPFGHAGDGGGDDDVGFYVILGAPSMAATLERPMSPALAME